jgi:hypothetical protein
MNSETPSCAEADSSDNTTFLRRHPVMHFAREFCFSFAGLTVFFDLLGHFFPAFGQPFPLAIYWFALWSAGGTWFFERRKMHQHAAPRPAPTP